MSYVYEQKKRGNTPAPASAEKAGAAERNIPNSMRLAALESGQLSPTAADKGRRVDLPEVMRAKMESSFGMDFSKVKLYESKMLGETGAEAMAQGNEIAFAPGKFDLASQEGQARLGHELSHVASQARGEVQGNGFLQDSALEARADREGAMAARGESAYGGAAAPLSSASPAAMAGPMQAKGSDKKRKKAKKNIDTMYEIASGDLYNSSIVPEKWKHRYLEDSRKQIEVSQEDSEKMADLGNNMTPEMMDDLIARRTQAINKLYDKRMGMEGEDQDKLDTLAGTSDESQDYNTIQYMINSMMYSDKYDALQDKLNDQMNSDPEFKKKAEEAYRMTENAVSGNNKFYKSEEGQKVYDTRMKEQAEKSKRRYLEGKYTHPSKKDKEKT